jgi:two-component system NtrC family response regulator
MPETSAQRPSLTLETDPARSASLRPGLLVVDHDPVLRRQMAETLSDRYALFFAENRVDALALVRGQHPSVVLLDLSLPPTSDQPTEGLRALAEIVQMERCVKVIALASAANRERALSAVEQGAYDFFVKPFDLAELKICVDRAFHIARLEEENRQMRQTQQVEDGLLGGSPQMESVKGLIRKAASVDLPVLITGESGTGKEQVARAIHQQSGGSGGPFIPVHCGAIPENLLESELFGHEKGAFTDAHVQRKGRVELAEGGTLFLDEIGEMSESLQIKMLRFLQDHRIERVGGRTTLQVNTRIVAATHRNLASWIEQGRFRDDLFHRLHVIAIHLPPLRERGNDALMIAQSLLQRQARRMGRKIVGFAPACIVAIQGYSWPGNVRELENRVKRGVVMAEGRWVTSYDMEMETAKDVAGSSTSTLKEAIERMEADLIYAAYRKYAGNITRASEALGITRPTFHKYMKQAGIGSVS